MKIQKPLTDDNIEELADRIYKLFRKNNMWSDCRIYFNGKALDKKMMLVHFIMTAWHFCMKTWTRMIISSS